MELQVAEAPEGVVNGTWPNNFTEGGVPARLEPNVFITPETVQASVIDAGLFSKEELCGGIGKDAEFCKN